MSDAPETPATPSSGGPVPPAAARAAPQPWQRVEPAGLMIGIGGVVLLLALWWLWATPRADRAAEADAARLAQIEQRLGALDTVREQTAALNARMQALNTLENRVQALAPLEGRVQQLAGVEDRVSALTNLESRLRALEERPGPPDLRPLETQVTGLAERTAAAERGAAQAADRAAANERRLAALEGRPAFDPATVAPREALDALSGRAERLMERIEANNARDQAAEAEQARRLQELARTQEERRGAAEQAATQRIGALETALQTRIAALDTQFGQRLSALDAQLGQRVAALDSALGQRLAALEQAQQKLAALEGRTARLAALDSLQQTLAAGQPLGVPLARIEQPPPALARWRDVAPPTEASLRLSFEDAAKAARAASDAAMQPDGSRQGVVDSALARLGGLVTVRRGDQVVWGDAAEAEIERARRALEAGDLEASLQYLEKLPPPARAAMQGWTDGARALLAARAALRQMAAAG
jgi:hypothetical protein